MKLIGKVVLLLTVASACSALASPIGSSAAATPAASVEKQSLSKIREQIQVLESVLNENLNQAFPAPFAYLDKARGAYLPGYGVIFAFEVNLNPQPPNLGPFGPFKPAPDARQRAEEAKKRKQTALEMSERVLADFGHTLAEIPAEESVAVVIHGAGVGEQGIEKSTTVVRAQKRDIDEFRANTIDRAAFLRRVQVLEY